jgi:hypothetical protein
MKKELTLFDKPRNVRRLLRLFYGMLAVLLVLDLFIEKHADFPWEGHAGFFAVFGFVACTLVIFIAKLLRVFVSRREDYYEK